MEQYRIQQNQSGDSLLFQTGLAPLVDGVLTDVVHGRSLGDGQHTLVTFFSIDPATVQGCPGVRRDPAKPLNRRRPARLGW